MPDIPSFTPVRGQIIHPIQHEAKGRVGKGYSVLDGLAGAEQGTPDMTIALDAGNVRLAYIPKAISAGNASFDASHETLDREDIIYIGSTGAIAVHKGDNLAVEDPRGNADWKEYSSPYPKVSLPSGVPLYVVHIAAGATAIHDEDIWPIAQYDPLPRGPWTLPPIRVTHDGGAEQDLLDTPTICEIEELLCECMEASDTRTVEVGYAGATAILMSNSEVPKTLGGVKALRNPLENELTSSKAIIATVGGSGDAGEWDFTFKLSRYK